MIVVENSKQNVEGLSKGQRCRLIREQTGLNQSEFGFVVGASKNAHCRSYKKDLTKVCNWPF